MDAPNPAVGTEALQPPRWRSTQAVRRERLDDENRRTSRI